MSTLRRLLGVKTANRDLAFDQWANYFNFNGLTYGGLQYAGTTGEKADEVDPTFPGYVQGIYKANGVVFACMAARMRLFTEARFQFRYINNGRPGDLFGTRELGPLEKPWANGTTGDLLGRALQDSDLGGNWFARRQRDNLIRMRPDWVTIIAGAENGVAEDAVPIGYLFHPGGPAAGKDPIVLLPEQVAHFAPVPDPIARFRGMSWLTPVLREIMGDGAATTHKLRFFENGATPNLVVTMDPKVKEDAFGRWIAKFNEKHRGFGKEYETLFLGGGADAKVVGADMKQIDFKTTQGHGETRIAAAAGVPPIIVGLSEGLEAATYSNYGQARRAFADGTMRPLWRNFAGSVAPLIKVPNGAELWYDDRDISFLQEDQKDAAEIQQTQSVTIKQLVEAGYEPESVIKAVTSGDLSALTHTGMYSVQLQPAGSVKDGVQQGTVVPVTGANSKRFDIDSTVESDEVRVLRALLTRN